MFCSSSVGIHLLRGLGAAGLLGLASTTGMSPWMRLAAAPLVVGAFFLLRGCPMCWLMGLFETISNANRPSHVPPERGDCTAPGEEGAAPPAV
ncbi:MAG: hypothetical protein WKG03_12995 [Telluria sp.]